MLFRSEGNAKKNPPKHPMNKRERQWLVAWHSKGHQRVRGSIDSTGQIKDIVLFTSHPPSSLASRRSRRGPVGLEAMEQVLRIAHVLLCSCQQQSHGRPAPAALQGCCPPSPVALREPRPHARFQERLSDLAAAARSNMRTIHTPHRDNPSCL